MKLFALSSVACVTLLMAMKIPAQTANKIENFTLMDVISNRSVSLNDYKGGKGVVLVFTSNACPYTRLYEDRIISLANEFQGRGIQFLLINSNTASDSNDDSVEQMAAVARQKGYTFPYLADKDHKAANLFGATKTPEVMVLQNSGDMFTLKYRGAIDDNPQLPNDVSAQYLKEAIHAVLNKQNLSVVEKRPTGCMIKKE